jgi:hypothetical protein
MPIALPLITRREIVAEYRLRESRLDDKVALDSGIRALRDKGGLSSGVSVAPHGRRGTFGGRLHLYSSINRPAVRAVARRDLATARDIMEAAHRLETSDESQHIIRGLMTLWPVVRRESAATPMMLARALSTPTLFSAVLGLQNATVAVRMELGVPLNETVLSGRVASIDRASAVIALPGAVSLPVPPRMLADAGVGHVGAPVTAIWELLPAGRTVLTLEPAVEDTEAGELAEPLVDLYGTPWGQVLAGVEREALGAEGRPTITIPEGIPEVD